jgi:hypothetical protein
MHAYIVVRECSAMTPTALSPEIHHTNDADSPDQAAASKGLAWSLSRTKNGTTLKTNMEA